MQLFVDKMLQKDYFIFKVAEMQRKQQRKTKQKCIYAIGLQG